MATPLNEIIRKMTADYLESMDVNDPPTPAEIEQELLEKVNGRIADDNANRAKNNQLQPLKTLTHAQIADIMLRLYDFSKIALADNNADPDLDILGMYAEGGIDKGTYVTSEDVFRGIARQYNYGLTTGDFREVLASIKDAAPRRSRCSDIDLIAVNNGIFDYKNKVLLPFDPEKVFLVKSRVNYNENATLVSIFNEDDGTTWDVESWMESLSDDPEIVQLFWEITGAIIRPNVPWNVFAMPYSTKGNNGKGTLVKMWRNICGENAYASTSIEDFGKDFMLEPLIRAVAILNDENNVGTFIDKAANLKAIVTGDAIVINRKFKAPIVYQFKGFMVQCMNDMPKTKDKSESLYRRMLIIPMLKCFTGAERRYIKNDYLGRPEVLEYVLKKVLHMDYYALSRPQATIDALSEYKEDNDPVRSFWNDHEDKFVWDLLPLEFLYEMYLSWFASTRPSGTPLGQKHFIESLRQVIEETPDWHIAQQRSKGRMDKPEQLIDQYDLKKWMDPSYRGPHWQKKCTPVLKDRYRGVVRTVVGSGPVLLDDGDDIDSTNGLTGS